jgi:hypothetical protein
MRFWKPQLALASAVAAVLALVVTLFVRRGVVDVLLMILIGAALVGMYLLRRYARAELLYRRHDASRRRRPGLKLNRSGTRSSRRDDRSGSGGASAVDARAEPPASVGDRDMISAGAPVQCR